MATIDEVMAAGWRAFQAGDLDRAEQAYRPGPRARSDGRPGLVHARRDRPGAGAARGGRGELPAGHPAEPDYSEALQQPRAWRSTRCGGARRRSTCSAGPSRSGRTMRRPTTTWAMRCTNAASSTRPRPAIGGRCELKPDYVEAHHNLGNALQVAGADGRGDRQLRPGPGDPARQAADPPEPGAGLARDGGLPTGLARVRVAAEMPAVRHPAIRPAALGRRPARRPDDPALRRPRAGRRDPVHPLCPDGPGPGRPGGRGLPRPAGAAPGDLRGRGPGRRRGGPDARISTCTPR